MCVTRHRIRPHCDSPVAQPVESLRISLHDAGAGSPEDIPWGIVRGFSGLAVHTHRGGFLPIRSLHLYDRNPRVCIIPRPFQFHPLYFSLGLVNTSTPPLAILTIFDSPLSYHCHKYMCSRSSTACQIPTLIWRRDQHDIFGIATLLISSRWSR
jgi:hypothetical protein